MATATANLPSIGVLAAGVPKLPPIAATVIAGELAGLANDASKAELVAAEAVVNSEETFGRAADLISAINATLKRADEARKEKTDPLLKAQKTLISLYQISQDKLIAAKAVLTSKATTWQRAEQRRQQEIADREAERIRKEAAALAAAQKALGDAEGAKQIIEEAAAVNSAPVRVTVTGSYGATAGTRVRKVGTVTDKVKFLNAVIKRAEREPEMANVLLSISILATPLNALATAVLEKKIPPVPGFTAEEVDTLNVR